MRAVGIAVWLATASGAVAQSADYPFDIPKQYPAALQAWHAIVPKQLHSEAWLFNFDCTASQNHHVKISGKAYLLATCCKPHDCGDNVVAFLVATDGSRASGHLFMYKGKPNAWFGNPNAQEKDLLTRVAQNPNQTF